MLEGYAKIHRRLLSSRVFQNEGLLKVWLWCLLKASYKENWAVLKTGTGHVEVQVRPGQFVFGRESASMELKMPQSTVWKRMTKLKNIGNLNIESNKQYSIITIINWDAYQSREIESDSEGNRQGTGREQAGNTNKKAKKAKKTNKEVFVIPEWLDKDAWADFKSHRIAIKKPMTELAEEMAIKKLFSLTNGNGTQRIVIEQSIINGWAGIFPVRADEIRNLPQKPTKTIKAGDKEIFNDA